MPSDLTFSHSSSSDSDSDSSSDENLSTDEQIEDQEEDDNPAEGEDSIMETSEASHDISFKSYSTDGGGLSSKISERQESEIQSLEGKLRNYDEEYSEILIEIKILILRDILEKDNLFLFPCLYFTS